MQVNAKMDGAEYGAIMEVNLLKATEDLRLGRGLPSRRTMTLNKQLQDDGVDQGGFINYYIKHI